MSVIVCGCLSVFSLPGVLASELGQRLGLGVPEVVACNGLMELLRALRRELVEGPVMEAVIGPSRPTGQTKRLENKPHLKHIFDIRRFLYM